MKHRAYIARFVLVWAVLVLLGAGPSLGSGSDYSVEALGGCTLEGVAEPLRETLQEHGHRVVTPEGILAEIWLRRAIPQFPGSQGAEYSTIMEGSFLGIIHYHKQAGDYRGQAIHPGTYTLRYLMIPSDGDHLGVSPTPDFVLLSPVGEDTSLSPIEDPDALVTLSTKASKTSHPNPLNLTMPRNQEGMWETDETHWAFEAKTGAKPDGEHTEVDFTLALVLVGKAEG